MEKLFDILSYKRGHATESEREAIRKNLLVYNPEVLVDDKMQCLAYYLVNDNADKTPSRTMFSCHTDTVHRSEGKNEAIFDENLGLIYKDDKAVDCLGADDGAGWWLLLEMYEAGIPGTYVFHRGEECGGIGSTGIVRHHHKFLQKFDRAIAFDRRGRGSVITHQGFSRCCSNDFAVELAAQFNALGLKEMAPDDTGVFTDTANYTDDIGECTNISCGYDHEHGPREILDVEFLLQLRDACLNVDWENLPTVRKAGENDPRDYTNWYGQHWNYSGNTGKKEQAAILKGHKNPWDTTVNDIRLMSFGEIVRWVRDSEPEIIADMLSEMGFIIDDLEAEAGYMQHEDDLDINDNQIPDYAYEDSDDGIH